MSICSTISSLTVEFLPSFSLFRKRRQQVFSSSSSFFRLLFERKRVGKKFLPRSRIERTKTRLEEKEKGIYSPLSFDPPPQAWFCEKRRNAKKSFPPLPYKVDLTVNRLVQTVHKSFRLDVGGGRWKRRDRAEEEVQPSFPILEEEFRKKTARSPPHCQNGRPNVSEILAVVNWFFFFSFFEIVFMEKNIFTTKLN